MEVEHIGQEIRSIKDLRNAQILSIPFMIKIQVSVTKNILVILNLFIR